MTLTNTPLYVLNEPVTSDVITPDNISKKASKYFSPKPSKVDDETVDVIKPSKVEVEEWKECLHCEDNVGIPENMRPVEAKSEPFQGMKNYFIVF